MKNQDMLNHLREHNVLLNVYLSDGLYISRLVHNDNNRTPIAVSSNKSLNKSVCTVIERGLLS